MLAQFGRAGIVKDVAGRLTESFAKNLEARLSGSTQNAEASDAGLDAGSLVVSILVEKLKTALKSITRFFK
jgi:carbon-monoxide dehydrogenase small subunit